MRGNEFSHNYSSAIERSIQMAIASIAGDSETTVIGLTTDNYVVIRIDGHGTNCAKPTWTASDTKGVVMTPPVPNPASKLPVE